MSAGAVDIDPDALLCALILVPRSFSRNRFHAVFEQPNNRKIRRRAARVRGVIRQLAGSGRYRAEWIGEQVMEDGQVLIRYRVPELDFSRSVALSALEAATLRFALARAGAAPLQREDQELVHGTMARLAPINPELGAALAEPVGPQRSE
jgi:hypothetical protein